MTIVLKIGQDSNAHENAEITNYARKFNDFSTSDFKIVCQDTVFHVHQWVLQEKSEYFAAILRNDFLENQNKELRIEDFEPKIIEMLLKYLYNGTIALPNCSKFEIRTEELRKLMIIADKYDFKELFKTCDSYLAQEFAYILDLCCFKPNPMNKEKAEKFLKSGIRFCTSVISIEQKYNLDFDRADENNVSYVSRSLSFKRIMNIKRYYGYTNYV